MIKNYFLLTCLGLTLSIAPSFGQAPTSNVLVSTFDDLSLNGSDTDFATTLQDTVDVLYQFQSGGGLFHGTMASWGGYSGFNYSNMRDDTTANFLNDKSAITAQGVEQSDNYGVAFVPIDYMTPGSTATIPIGAKVVQSFVNPNTNDTDEVIGVAGLYVTNTTYAYHYMKDNFGPNDWFQLTIKGYFEGQPVSNSVQFMLAEDTTLVDEWTWVDLSSLGQVDSLSFDLSSTDTLGGFGMNNPSYFALDNLTLNLKPAVGIDQASQKLQVSVYPNPAKDRLYINYPVALDLTIYDLSGRVVLTRHQSKSISVSTLSAGTYFLKLSNTAGQKTLIKWVKQ